MASRPSGVVISTGEAFLAAVDREEVAAKSGAPVHAKHAAYLAAAGRLHFDHLGAHVGEEHRGVGALLGDGEVEDADAFEWSGHWEASYLTAPFPSAGRKGGQGYFSG